MTTFSQETDAALLDEVHTLADRLARSEANLTVLLRAVSDYLDAVDDGGAPGKNRLQFEIACERTRSMLANLRTVAEREAL